MDEVFERDEVERRLKEALGFAFNHAGLDENFSIDIDGPFAVLQQYSLETNEVIAQFEVSFTIALEND